MLKAVLLDLDNTLVHFDEPAFYGRYFQRLAPRFADLGPPDVFQQRVVAAIGSLLGNDGEISNRDCFLRALADGTGADTDALWQRFIDFYRTEYDRIPVRAAGPVGLHRTLGRLRETGLPLVVATNPVFPMIVQEKRLCWVDLAAEQFELVTHMENTSFVKPRKGYYLQICRRIGRRPEDCLMVGNDAVNDMAAARTGMKTYRVDEVDPIDYGSLALTADRRAQALREAPPPDFTGPFARVPEAVAQLME